MDSPQRPYLPAFGMESRCHSGPTEDIPLIQELRVLVVHLQHCVFLEAIVHCTKVCCSDVVLYRCTDAISQPRGVFKLLWLCRLSCLHCFSWRAFQSTKTHFSTWPPSQVSFLLEGTEPTLRLGPVVAKLQLLLSQRNSTATPHSPLRVLSVA